MTTTTPTPISTSWKTEPAWLAPYATFSLRLLTTCVVLIRRPRSDLGVDGVRP